MVKQSEGRRARVTFVSCNETPWGGSEELWARAALVLQENGARISVAKPNIDWSVDPISNLRREKAQMTDLVQIWPLPGRLLRFLNFLARPVMFALQLARLWFHLLRAKPDLIVLSQGGCWDGFFMAPVLRRFDAPYLLICQKASDLYWPPDHLRQRVRDFVREAAHVYCVSRHNLRLLEEQIGARLQSASVIRNPFLVDYDAPLPWPQEDGVTRLACVGRLYPMEKGQDILLRVLAQRKWQERKLEVSVFGAGGNLDGLRDMARLINCNNVRFCGHVKDVNRIWEEHHALVLPSRAEGLPLVLVEAMLVGRVAIVGDAGGSREVIADGETAFLMRGQDEAGLDDALERAWELRDKWEELGKEAARAIREQVPRDPAAALAANIELRFQSSKTQGAKTLRAT